MNGGMWTSKEVSEFLALNEETIRRLTRERKIPAYKIGQSWRYDPGEIKCLSWAENNKEDSWYENVSIK